MELSMGERMLLDVIQYQVGRIQPQRKVYTE